MPNYVPTQKNPEAIERLDDITNIEVSSKVKAVAEIKSTTNDAITLWNSLSKVYDALNPSQLLKLPSAVLMPLLLAKQIASVAARAANATIPANTLQTAINGTIVLAQIGTEFARATLTGDFSRCDNHTTAIFYNGTVGSNHTVDVPFGYKTGSFFGATTHHRMATSNICVNDTLANATRFLLECYARTYAHQHGDSKSSINMKEGLFWGAIALGVCTLICLAAATACLVKRGMSSRSDYQELRGDRSPVNPAP